MVVSTPTRPGLARPAAGGRDAARRGPAAMPGTLSTPVTVALVVALTCAAGFLRLWNSAAQSLRLDEGFSLRYAAYPLAPVFHGKTLYLPSLFQAIAADVHPPGYLLLLHFWMKVFGTDLAVLRLPSELAGTLAVPAVYLLGASLYGRGAGLGAALLGALSPFWIWHAQEVRMYPFLLLSTIVSTYGLVQALEYRRRWGWVLLFAGSFVAIYVQYFAFMVLLAQAIFVAGHWRHYTRRQLVTWLCTMMLLALTYVPWALTLKHNYHGASDPALQKPSLYTPLIVLAEFLYGYLTTPLTSQILAAWPLLVLLGLALTAFGGAATRRGALLWLLFLVPIVVAFAISFTVRPFISERYLIVCTPALYIMLSVAVTRLRGRAVRLLIVLLCSAVLLVSWHVEETNAANPNLEDFQSVAAYVNTHARPADAVALDSFFNQDAYSYYIGTNLPLYALPAVPTAGGGRPHVDVTQLGRYLHGIEAGRQRLWVVYYLERNFDPNGVVQQYLAYHTAGHTVVYGGPYERNDPHYPASYTNVQLVLYKLIPQRAAAEQVRPETLQQFSALTHIAPTWRQPFAPPFGAPGGAAPLMGHLLAMPRPAQSWYFPAVPSTVGHVHLTLFNSNQFRNDVFVTVVRGKRTRREHVFIPALSNLEIALISWGPGAQYAVLRITTKSAVVPLRIMVNGHTELFEYASLGPVPRSRYRRTPDGAGLYWFGACVSTCTPPAHHHALPPKHHRLLTKSKDYKASPTGLFWFGTCVNACAPTPQ